MHSALSPNTFVVQKNKGYRTRQRQASDRLVKVDASRLICTQRTQNSKQSNAARVSDTQEVTEKQNGELSLSLMEITRAWLAARNLLREKCWRVLHNMGRAIWQNL